MRVVSVLAIAALAAAPASAEQCRTIGRYGAEQVPIYQRSDGVVAFRADVDVNTDGALQSYKADDLGFFENGRLQTRSALNTICNGVNIRSASGALVYGASQCARLIAEFERIRNFGWLKAGENYVEFYAIALKPGTALPGRSKGVPCERDGYYVSQVARPIDPSRGVCDPDRWVDALRIPAIVLPIDRAMQGAGVGLHDLAAVRLPGTESWVGAIVGDTNPTRIGEGTVRLLLELRGTDRIPANYRETVRLKVEAADYVVFPGTAGRLGRLSNDSGEVVADLAGTLVRERGLDRTAPVCPAGTP